MKRNIFVLLAALFAGPFSAFAQEDLSTSEAPMYQPNPWTKALTLGAAIWPTSKERIRLGYHWQPSPWREWVHEAAYIEAIRIGWADNFRDDQYGALRGAQLKNELRIYHKKQTDGPAYWYHGIGLAYMYTTHNLSKGIDCEEDGWSCAYIRRFEDMVTHTNTLTGSFGLMLRTNRFVNFNFYTNLGLRGSYFPKTSSEGYFGRGPLLINNDHFLLLPYVRVGASLMFILSRRKH